MINALDLGDAKTRGGISRQDAKTLTEEITPADGGADSVKRGKEGLVGACRLEEEFEVKRD